MSILQTLQDKLKNRKGFTLIEMIVVIVIIGILAAVLIGSLTGYITKARNASAKMEAGNVLTAVQAYASENEITTADISRAATYVEEVTGVAVGDNSTTSQPRIISINIDDKSTVTGMVYISKAGRTCKYNSSANAGDEWTITD